MGSGYPPFTYIPTFPHTYVTSYLYTHSHIPPHTPHTHTTQAEHCDSGKLAALKRVPIQEESELDDFMVEIDILAECKHPNIVKLYEAFFYDQALWVSRT